MALVLIVGDEDEIRAALADVISAAGHTVELAPNGAEAGDTRGDS